MMRSAIRQPQPNAPAGHVSAAAVLNILNYCAERGVAGSALLERCGISPGILTAPNGRVEFPRCVDLLNEGAAALADPYFGIRLAEHTPLGLLGHYGQAIRFSADLGEAMSLAVRFYRFWTDATELVHGHRDGLVGLVMAAPDDLDPNWLRHDVEHVMKMILVVGKQLVHGCVRPSSVRFRHAPPPSTDYYRTAFEIEPEFSAPENAIWFKGDALGNPIGGADPQMKQVFETHLQQALDSIPHVGTLERRIAALMAELLPRGEVSLERIAATLGISGRTLQRELDERGISWRDLHDRVRMALAEEYLGRSLAMNEVAYRLGFAEVSSFYRAFHRWKGITPARFRQRTSPSS
jgi:AraC-like DNA-binding protein